MVGKMLGERKRKARECFGAATTKSGTVLEAKVSQTDFCGLSEVFSGAVKGRHGRSNGSLNGHHLFEARNSDLSHDDVAKGTIRGCGGTFHFVEKSTSRVAELDAVAVEALDLSTETALAKGEETGAKLFVDGGLIQRGGC